MKIKSKIYDIIRDDDENGLLGNIFDGVIIFFILVSIVQVIADTFTLPLALMKISSVLEILSVIVFTAEYLLRLWTSDLKFSKYGKVKSRLKYIFTPMAIIDLLSILPFYIPFIIPIDLRILRALRIIRLLRLFKMNRYTSAMSTIFTVLKKRSSQLLSSVFVVGLLMVISAVLMYNIESEAQPEIFHNAFDALWWSIATFTTVGYGDIYPITAAGKVLSAVIAMLGIGLVAVPTGIISAGFTELIENEPEIESSEESEDITYCPHCGKKLK